MILQELSLLNYKNVEEATLSLSPSINCFVGANGMGKTNLVDAIYFLSFCRSASYAQDTLCIRHDAEEMMVRGRYVRDDGGSETVCISLRRGGRKRIRRDDKDVRRVSEHVGRCPLVLISPQDGSLASGGSEERRRFVDIAISQHDPAYLEALIRYDKALRQRNALLKQEAEPEQAVMEVLEAMMDEQASVIAAARRAFVEDFRPELRRIYTALCNTADEDIDIALQTHADRGPLLPQLAEGRNRERIVGYTLHGPHKDDLLLTLRGYPVKQEASQGQTKTLTIAMKLAQFSYIDRKGAQRKPLLLLDDIFDKLDAGRVARIVDFVTGEGFGQIFITDTNREHIDQVLAGSKRDYRLYHIADGAAHEATPPTPHANA